MANTPGGNTNGLTLTLIGQAVRFEYRAPVSSQGTGGPLSAALAQVQSEPKSQGSKEIDNTIAHELGVLPYLPGPKDSELISKIDSSVKRVSRYFRANYDTTNKVNMWYESLRALQKAALGGRRRATVSRTVLDKIVTEMKPYNLGLVVKYRIQARLWSSTPKLNFHPVSTGGFARVVTLATFYGPLTDISQLANRVKDCHQIYDGAQFTGTRIHEVPGEVVFEDHGNNQIRTRVLPSDSVMERLDKDGKVISTISALHNTSLQPEQKKRLQGITLMKLG